LSARQYAIIVCAKSRQTPTPSRKVSSTVVMLVEVPILNRTLLRTQSRTARTCA